MGQFDQGERSSPARVSQTDAHQIALDGASILFERAPIVRSGNGFPLLMNPAPGERPRIGVQAGQTYLPGDVGNPDAARNPQNFQNYPGIKDRVPTPTSTLPRLQHYPPTASEPMVYGPPKVKQTDLNKPYVSETNEKANSFFESVARIGSAAYFIHRDQAQRTATLEAQLANTKLVSAGTAQNFQLARDTLLTNLKNPIASAEVAMEAMAKNYPAEIFNTSPIPKVNGGGNIMVPNHWELAKLSAADRVAAERYMNLVGLRETLTHNWPPTPGAKLIGLPTNLQSQPFIQAEKLGAHAARFDAASGAFTGEATKVLKSFESAKIANSNMVFKNVGTLAGAWVANTAVDAVVQTKHGPSLVTWTADLTSPAILLTKYGLGTKFAVVTGAHVLAKLYDKYNEKP